MGFAAPEQYGFAPADVRSDVYSVSQMLGYLLTGVSPEPGSKAFSQAIGDSQVVPADIAEIIKKGTVFEPGNRYQSIVDFSRALAVTCENPTIQMCCIRRVGRMLPGCQNRGPRPTIPVRSVRNLGPMSL